MRSALDPHRSTILLHRKMTARLAARAAERGKRSDASHRGARTKAHDLSRDPFFNPAFGAE